MLLRDHTGRLPGGVSFPGYGGEELDINEISGEVNTEEWFNNAFGCEETPEAPVWDLSDLEWEDIMSIAGEVANYIEKYDGSKNDLMEGSEWLEDFSNKSFDRNPGNSFQGVICG